MRADLREGGRWSLPQRLKNDVLYGAMTLGMAVASRVPARWAPRLGRAVGRVAHLAWLGRRAARDNLARVLASLDDAEREALLARSYLYLGERLVELFAPARGPTLALDAAGRACLGEATAAGRGVVLASAHLGPWEQVAAALARACSLTVVAREVYDPRLTARLTKAREANGVRAVYRGAPGAPAAMLRTLKRGEVLGIPMDFRSRVPSIEVPFLGRLAWTAVGPARLALRQRARVVVATAAASRDGGEPDCVTAEHVASDDLTPGERGERELTRRLNDALGARILRAPHAWPWMHPRWD